MPTNNLYHLRNGAFTPDKRKDRIVFFDDRSRNFPIRAVVKPKIARKPITKTWRCAQTLDQGHEGACVGFGWTAELIATPQAVTGLDSRFAREKVYWEAQKIDGWNGGAYPGANPFYEGTAVIFGAKICQKLGYMDEYRWAFGLDDLIIGLSVGPAVLGVNWREGMEDVDKDGFIHVTGGITGGHCLIARGVNVTKKYFTLRNSWGDDWGINGDALVTFDDMAKLLQDEGEACIPVHRHLLPKNLQKLVQANQVSPEPQSLAA